VEETTGNSVDKQKPYTLTDEPGQLTQLNLSLGNLQYGQSRDIYLSFTGMETSQIRNPPVVTATVDYSLMTSAVYSCNTQRNLLNITELPDAEVAYHISRSRICNFLSTLFPLENGEHTSRMPVNIRDDLSLLIRNLPASQHQDESNQSLIQDLYAPGQISIALSTLEFYHKWGCHYLLSLWNAHTRQICNSFKDPGPLQYCKDSPLFTICRDRLDNAFDNLPPPIPSNSTTYRGVVPMNQYNNANGVCFAGSTLVSLASGRSIPIRLLRKGTVVKTPAGPRRVAALLKTSVEREIMCRIGTILVTPWHPLSNDSKDWFFPAYIADKPVRYSGAIYSVLLQQDQDCNAHAIYVNNMWGVTLGHGLLTGSDIRAHQFFGNYAMVTKSFAKMGIRKDGVVIGGGVQRSGVNRTVSGFKPYQP
jgi:hypothetical protein